MTSSNVYRSTTESKLTDSLAFRLIVTALFVAVAFAITGCSGSFDPKLSGTEPATGASGITFKGHIQGGQAPIYDANVYVFQTGESGYPGAGVPANVSFITSTAPGTFNGAVNGNNYGPHVNTDSNGNFSFTLNNCTPGAGVYIVSYGGQPIYGTQNIAAGEMASMGVCPSNSTTGLFANNPFVNVTEVSTVAFAYAVGGFTAAGYDFSHISTSATNITAMNNAFNLAQQLFSISTTSGANSSSANLAGATFDNAFMNTMANILADCVNSSGVTSNSSPCYTLFQNATSSGTPGSGVIPTDTASAMINIVHNTGTGVAAISALANNSYAPYTPTTSGFIDFSNAIVYATPSLTNPVQLALDSAGNVYALSAPGSVVKISPTKGIIGAASLSGTSSLALDQSNNLFFLNTTTHTISEYGSSGTGILGIQAANSPFTFSALGSGTYYLDPPSMIIGPTNDIEVAIDNGNADVVRIPFSSGTYSTASVLTSGIYSNGTQAIVEDGTGTTWVPSYNNHFESTFTSNGTYISGNTITNWAPSALTLDAGANAWIVDSPNSTLVHISASLPTTVLGAFAGGGLSFPTQPEVDGLDTVWIPNSNAGACTISKLPSGASSLYANGIAAKNCSSLHAALSVIGIDQGGNIWATVANTSTGNGYVIEILGAASPTIQPLSSQSLHWLPTNTSSADIRP